MLNEDRYQTLSGIAFISRVHSSHADKTARWISRIARNAFVFELSSVLLTKVAPTVLVGRRTKRLD